MLAQPAHPNRNGGRTGKRGRQSPESRHDQYPVELMKAHFPPGTKIRLTPKPGSWRKPSKVKDPVTVREHKGSNVVITTEYELYDLDDYDVEVIL